jgi:hypothetical protein
MAAALPLLLGTTASAPVAYLYMAGLGVSVGMGATVKPALWAELYGVEHLGAIKSLVGTLMVVSTAASPLLLGILLDRGTPLDAVVWAGIITTIAGAMGAGLALRSPRGATEGS